MALAWLVTLLAIAGVWAGVFLGHGSNRFAHQLAAGGGGLLCGIGVFWLIPEVGETTGRWTAVMLALGVAALLSLLDRMLGHSGPSARQHVVWPLLLATVIHSLLDGWAVRLLGVQALANVAVTAGLALHKIPEGAAVGWITRRSLASARRAFLVSTGAELFTLAGAFAEPALNASGAARFGIWWSASVLSVVAGGFLFLGWHAVSPVWRRRDVMAIFLATFLLVGVLSFLRTGGI